ncbi:hypothetical protein COL154_003046 [Colletotrichum chrysophilum]|uniref:uncharacterized protein n=1 Tax=Colletotrichum chrysophilum TaxID=1836956 RepID=UPI002300AA21|nr:uncharacterized protein COL26b_011202 [Colletotrichum chrysophilum]KAJ0346032.1 hypothetical protein KNSL1_007829 [Colletotrichum chrysophilum]KAJ0367600.1 hypothetical protein COL26b_011202 [Colletotrichum chrysophilum]KAJ0367824.1 hypothetical protein COL154_003046 [Colletotrichum chrysophilum]
MSHNILITGAAGYIGGSVLADFLERTSGPINKANIFAVVRTEEQAQKLHAAKLGVNVVQFDLANQQAVAEAIVENKIDLVIHTAGVIDHQPLSNLMKGLGELRVATDKDVYFVHTSVATLFTEDGGWSSGEVKDTDGLYEKEKEIGGPNHARLSNILVMDQAEAFGVTPFIIPVPLVYGRGTGQGRKLSVNIPAMVRASKRLRVVHKFDKDADLVELYRLLTENILLGKPIPSGREGYYFATVHRVPWWDVMDRIAVAMHARGLVDEPTTKVWPSYDVAADTLGFPRLYIRAMGTSK